MSEAIQVDVQAEIDRIAAQWPKIEAHLTDDAHIARQADNVSRWGVGQQLLHLLRVKKMIFGGIRQLLAAGAATAPNVTSPNVTSDVKRMILTGGIPRGMGTAPEAVRVDTPPTLDEIRKELAEARAAFDAIAGKASEIEAAEATFPHHHLGAMNGAEWTRFIAHHNDLHLAIIEDILRETATS